jgi:hypothetical protein
MKIFLSLFLFFTFTSLLIAEPKNTLGESEVKGSPKTDFINRSTNRADTSTRRKNFRLGAKLASKITEKPDKVHSVEGFAVQRVSSTDPQKFGADVLTVGEDVQYGHIHSLMRVISSYIENSFEYSTEDSELIAKYVLYYNAFHRKDKPYFTEKFEQGLVSILDDKNIGISRNYKNWAGSSQLIIPLENRGGSGKSTKNDITLDELENEVNKIIDKNKAKPEEKKKFEEIIEKRKETEVAKTTTDTKKTEGKKSVTEPTKKDEKTDTVSRVDKVPPKKEETEPKKEPIERELLKKEIKEKEKVVKENEAIKKAADTVLDTNKKLNNENVVVKKENEVLRKENVEIKKENVAVKATNEDLKKELDVSKAKEGERGKFSENVIGGKIYYMKVIQYIPQSGRYHNEIYLIDPDKDDIVIKGDYTDICGKAFYEFGKYIVSVGCEESGYKMVLLNKFTLKFEFKSETEVFLDTPIIVDPVKQELLAIENVEDKYYISRFDRNLKRLDRSDAQVNPNSRITLYGEKLYLTSKEESGKSNAILVLSKKDLKLIKRIQP